MNPNGPLRVGLTRDISLGGVFIETDCELPYGAQLELTILIDALTEPITVCGQVRWSEGGVGVGVQFDGLRARDVWALGKFLGKKPSRPPE